MNGYERTRAAIRLVAGLSVAEKMTLIVLADYANNDGECYPSMAAVAERSGLGLRSVARSIAALEKAGYLVLTRQTGRPNKYQIVLPDPGHSGIPSEPTYATVAYPPGHSGIPPMPDRHTPYATVAYEDTNKNTKEEKREEAAAAAPPDETGAVFDAYQNNIGQLTAHLSDVIGSAIDDYSASWVLDAIKVAAEREKRSWRYILGILRSWQREGRGEPGQPQQNGNGSGEAAWERVWAQVQGGKWTLPMDGPESAAVMRMDGGWPRLLGSQTRETPFLKREFLQEYYRGKH